MAELRTTLRVRAEGLGVAGRAIITFLVLFYDARTGGGRGEWALVAFAGGQLVYGIIVLVTYLAFYGTQHLSPRMLQIKRPSDPELLQLALTMTSQSVVKLVLTEGDKLILSWFSPLEDQGGYAIAVNYGSLVARIVFQPVEETSRLYFSKALTSISTSSSPHMENLRKAANALLALLSVQAALSVIVLVFGTTYLPIVLHILLPQPYLLTSAPKVLSAWVWYIPVLAFNGGLEAFLSSVATPQDLNQQSRWMAVFSATYILVAVMLYRLGLGDVSLVYANIVNLSARITYSVYFISSFFSRHDARNVLEWNRVLPGWPVLLTCGLSAASIWASARQLDMSALMNGSENVSLLTLSVVLHAVFGAFMASVCLTTWWMSSGRHLSIPSHTKLQ